MQMLRFAKFQMVMHKKKTVILFIPCGMLNNHLECSPEHDGSNRNGTKSFQNGISNLLLLHMNADRYTKSNGHLL